MATRDWVTWSGRQVRKRSVAAGRDQPLLTIVGFLRVLVVPQAGEAPWTLGDLPASLSNPASLEQLLVQFPLLDTPAKLKILTGMVGIRRRELVTVADQLEQLLRIAAEDIEPWVSVTAHLLIPFPRHQTVSELLELPGNALDTAVTSVLEKRMLPERLPAAVQ